MDAYGASVKSALAEGRPLTAKVQRRPGEGRPVPPVPPAPSRPVVPQEDKGDPEIISDVTA